MQLKMALCVEFSTLRLPLFQSAMAKAVIWPLWLLCLSPQRCSTRSISIVPSIKHHERTLAMLEFMGKEPVSCSLLELEHEVKAEVLGLWRDRGRPKSWWGCTRWCS